MKTTVNEVPPIEFPEPPFLAKSKKLGHIWLVTTVRGKYFDYFDGVKLYTNGVSPQACPVGEVNTCMMACNFEVFTGQLIMEND